MSQITSSNALEKLAKVREICLKFPEVTEAVDKFGHTSFRIKDKPFVILGETEGAITISIKTLKETQELLIQSGRFFKSPYIGHHGWVSVERETTLNWDELKDYMLEGYLRSAPKKIVKDMT
jgi:predicted DNA-binding protein (MmcQ/YjbR family)